MSRRWIAPWAGSATKPAVYHCLSRVVDRRFVLEDRERERFRWIMRAVEGFSGCRVLSYCCMSNHFHLLLEVTPMPEGGLSDGELLRRLGELYSDAEVAEVAGELANARKWAGQAGEAAAAEEAAARVAAIHARFTYRMHDLSEFMKTLLQRFTRWFNRTHGRRGTLWEERYKSVIVESGVAARTIAAYIDLNPVRAGIVPDPAHYRWSSYGEAVGGGGRGRGARAREGLVRACMGHQGAGFEAGKWKEVARVYRRAMGLALARRSGRAAAEAGTDGSAIRSGPEAAEVPAAKDHGTGLPDMGMAGLLLRQVRYFSDGVVIGGKEFVNEVFARHRGRFTAGRADGARRLRGCGAAAAGVLWSARNLRVRI